MTYGPPPGNSGGYPPNESGGQPNQGQPGGYQPGGYQSPQQPGYQPSFGGPSGQNSVSAALRAPSSGNPTLRFTGIALVVAGLAMVVFSFFNWCSVDLGEGGISVSGIGSVSIDAPEGADADQVAEAESDGEENSSAPGASTIVVGLLIAGAGAALIVNKYPGIAAAFSAVLGLIGVILALVFVADPYGAVSSGDTGRTEELFDPGVGWGLWIVTAGAFVALVVAGFATYLALTSKPVTPAGPGYGQPPQPGFAPPQQPGGYGQPQQGYPSPPQPGGYGQPQNPGEDPGRNPEGRQPGSAGQ